MAGRKARPRIWIIIEGGHVGERLDAPAHGAAIAGVAKAEAGLRDGSRGAHGALSPAARLSSARISLTAAMIASIGLSPYDDSPKKRPSGPGTAQRQSTS